MPKATYATDSSSKTERPMTERLIAAVIAKTPLADPPQVRYVEEWVKLNGYQGTVRQLIVTGLGHELPTFFLTNDDSQGAQKLGVIEASYASAIIGETTSTVEAP